MSNGTTSPSRRTMRAGAGGLGFTPDLSSTLPRAAPEQQPAWAKPLSLRTDVGMAGGAGGASPIACLKKLGQGLFPCVSHNAEARRLINRAHLSSSSRHQVLYCREPMAEVTATGGILCFTS